MSQFYVIETLLGFLPLAEATDHEDAARVHAEQTQRPGPRIVIDASAAKTIDIEKVVVQAEVLRFDAAEVAKDAELAADVKIAR